MIRLDIDMPLGCIYEKNGKTEYCPLCNHYDVPFCQVLDDNEAEIGIDERPCYCPLSAEPQDRKGKWILDRSGAYCCSKCMEPCATYVMMKPRDKFCKMCGARMEEADG